MNSEKPQLSPFLRMIGMTLPPGVVDAYVEGDSVRSLTVRDRAGHPLVVRQIFNKLSQCEGFEMVIRGHTVGASERSMWETVMEATQPTNLEDVYNRKPPRENVMVSLETRGIDRVLTIAIGDDYKLRMIEGINDPGFICSQGTCIPPSEAEKELKERLAPVTLNDLFMQVVRAVGNLGNQKPTVTVSSDSEGFEVRGRDGQKRLDVHQISDGFVISNVDLGETTQCRSGRPGRDALSTVIRCIGGMRL